MAGSAVEQHRQDSGPPDGSSAAASSVQVVRDDEGQDDEVRAAGLQLSRAPEPCSEEDSRSSTSSSGLSSVAEDEDLPMEELGGRGWIDNAVLRSEVNGIALPGSDSIQIGKIHARNAPNLHVGQRVFIKSKGDLIIKSVRYGSDAGQREDGGLRPLENGSVKDKDGIGNNLDDRGDAAAVEEPMTRRDRVVKWFQSQWCTITVSLVALILLLITVLCVWLTSSSGTTNTTIPGRLPASPNDTSINNDPTIKGVRMVSRVEWAAQPPVKEPNKLEILPPPYVIISHTATTFCYTQAQCVLNVRVAQTFHIESKGWDDIAYNFLVGGDGNVYEGRGWGVEGSHTFNYNIMSIGISFIGTFNTVEPTKAQLHAATKLIELGLEKGHISRDYKLLGHRQCVKTESPGEVLYNIIKTWKHWSPTP